VPRLSTGRYGSPCWTDPRKDQLDSSRVSRHNGGHKDVRTAMVGTHVLNGGGRGVPSPADALTSRAAARQAETARRAQQGVTIAQTPAGVRLTRIGRVGIGLQPCGLHVMGRAV
jgi:hypothetical protein